MAATKHMQTFCSGSQQNLAAALGSFAAAVLQHLQV
jgi:biotin operon repressor